MTELNTICREMRGFNYNPSYTTTLAEMWSDFDESVWRDEIKRGKAYFPKLNTLRVWLDWHSYQLDPKLFMKNLSIVLNVCDENAIRLHPTLFNRWHDSIWDYGGIYVDHFRQRDFDKFEPYIHDVVATFNSDTRIVMWDLCNEPQHFSRRSPIDQLEVEWLSWVASAVRNTGAVQPLTIGTMRGTNVEWTADLCDVLCIHPYGGWGQYPYMREDIALEIVRAGTYFEWRQKSLNEFCETVSFFARILNKPLIANETCQGSLNDTTREKIIRTTLGILKKHEIGWCAWQLHGGRMISGNRKIMDSNCFPDDGAYMAFINADGTLRRGHGTFNEY